MNGRLLVVLIGNISIEANTNKVCNLRHMKSLSNEEILGPPFILEIIGDDLPSHCFCKIANMCGSFHHYVYDYF